MYWSEHAEKQILNTFKGITAVAPSILWMGLFLNNPSDTSGGTEISYTGYARQKITFSTPTDGSQGVMISTDSDVTFATSATSAGNATYAGIFDSQTGGNMWTYIEFDELIQVTPGVAPVVVANELTFESVGNYAKSFKAKYLNLLRGIDLLGFTPHIALFDGNPDGSGAELTGSNYGRIDIDFNSPVVQGSGQTTIINNGSVQSARAATNWGTWAYTGVLDKGSGGSVVAFRQEPEARVMSKNRLAKIDDKAFTIGLN